MTCWTCSGVTFSSSNLIVQTVPPVKSIAYWSPTFPPVIGPSRMKIRPGMVIRRENAKNQFRLPMTSNTPAGLAREVAAGRRAGEELLLGDVEERRLAGPRLLDDDPEHRPGHDDRREHRHQHADDQD